MYKEVNGGVCAPKGFKAAGIHCGVKGDGNTAKKDLALIVSDTECAAAGTFTTNKVKAAPVYLSMKNVADGRAKAIVCNSGNANACAPEGDENALKMCEETAKLLGTEPEKVLVASTGVIGQRLDLTPIAAGLPKLAEALSPQGSADAAAAIMTTDTAAKEAAVEFTLGGKTCRLGGMAKGSGMIHPNMATMLVFITTDAAVSPALLQKALSTDVTETFNMVSVDGDTSTNDMVTLMASGLAGNPCVTAEGEDFSEFMKALNTVTMALCRSIAGDGEGATKLLECRVTGAPDRSVARTVAKSVICSSLVKAAMFGADANWGRVLCAIGYSGAAVDVTKIGVAFRSAKGEIVVCENGAGVDFSEEKAKEILLEKEIDVLVSLNDGEAEATAWGCDLTYDYVKINGDYRT
jgi:glutamate N-acetyltransferase/amino-acid N-acetyltransferase